MVALTGQSSPTTPAPDAQVDSGVAAPAVRAAPHHGAPLMRWVDPVLYSYSQIFFTQSRAVGALLLAATFVHPPLGAWGLAAVLLSFGVVRLAQFSSELAARGMYGYNPLLVGLALGEMLQPSPSVAVLLVAAVIAAVFLQTALESAVGYFFNLPVLSLPFVIVCYLGLAASVLLEEVQPAVDAAALLGAGQAPWLPHFAGQYLRSLGAIFFAPELVPGLVVLAALLVYSRIAGLLSIVGFAVAYLIVGQLSLTSPLAPLVFGYNGVLIAIALGGVWFVPRPSSFVFAAFGVLLTAFITLAAYLFLMPLRLPVLILPFNLAMVVALYAMRQRVRDGAPKSVDFAAGAPEVNLNYYRARVARFGSALSVRIALPFSGRWTITQGVDGEHTHRGPWKEALDFEVVDRSGSNHLGAGTALKDFFCYRLPVFAPADGTVIRVQRDVPDNPIGQRNPTDNWGNLVMLQHGVGLYSLVCHLAPGTVEVAEGQFVRQGARLGLCGNSGRSFVPHVHFQLQTAPRIGAPTRAMELYDLVVEGAEGPVVHRSRVPRSGESVRNLERKEEIAGLFAFPVGSRLRFRVEDGSGHAREERVVSRIDLYNQLYLESDLGAARLYFENQARQFVVYDHHGPRSSALYLLYAAAPRVPLEQAGGITWDDVLSRRHFRPPGTAWLVDLCDPFLPLDGYRMEYRLSREGGGLAVLGRGRFWRREVETFARFEPGRGPVELRLRIGSIGRLARLVEVEDEV